MWGRFMKLYLCLFAACLMSACGVTPKDTPEQETVQKAKLNQGKNQKPDHVSMATHLISGTLTNEGVMCQAMRGDDGILYVFEDLPDELQSGDQLNVERNSAADLVPSHCDQGEVIKWTLITKLVNGKAGQVWHKDK